MVESGYPDFVASSWQGLLSPAGTPADIVRRWHGIAGEVLQLPDVRHRFALAATEAVASRAPDEFAAFIAAEGRRWGALARRAGAVAE
jgi:tripartite-type tricarboxylate transporter receptor subunit TctC